MEIENGSNVIPFDGEASQRVKARRIAVEHNSGAHDAIIDTANSRVSLSNAMAQHADRVWQHYMDVNAGKTTFDPDVVHTNPETGQPYTHEEMYSHYLQAQVTTDEAVKQAHDLLDRCPDCQKTLESSLEDEHDEGLHHESAEGPHDECSKCIEEDKKASEEGPSATVSDLGAFRDKRREDRNFQAVEDFRNDNK